MRKFRIIEVLKKYTDTKPPGFFQLNELQLWPVGLNLKLTETTRKRNFCPKLNTI